MFNDQLSSQTLISLIHPTCSTDSTDHLPVLVLSELLQLLHIVRSLVHKLSHCRRFILLLLPRPAPCPLQPRPLVLAGGATTPGDQTMLDAKVKVVIKDLESESTRNIY